MVKLIASTVLFLLWLSGCASLGPAASASRNFQPLDRAIQAEDGKAIHHFRAVWLPNTSGYSASNQPKTPLGGPASKTGFLVLAESAIYFGVWEPGLHEYEMLYRAPYSSIERNRLISLGEGRRLVIQQADSLQTDTFEITGDDGLVNQPGSELAYRFINEKLGRGERPSQDK